MYGRHGHTSTPSTYRGRKNRSTIRLFIHIVIKSEYRSEKGVSLFNDWNQDDSIYLQFMIGMAMATFPFNLDFRHE
jgi:hypothetical protein